MRNIMKSKLSSGGKILIFAFILYVSITVVMLFRHEPWRDEGQAWLIVRDSPDIWAVFNSMGYEGTPALWYVIIFPLAKLGLPFASMSVVHCLLSILSVFIFLRYSPFRVWQKIMFIFGYLILYEFNVIARSYVLMNLLLFALASVYPGRHTKYGGSLYVCLLILLMNVSVFGVIAGGVIGVMFFYEKMRKFGLRALKRWQIILAVNIFVIGGILVPFMLLRKPIDIGAHGSFNFMVNREHFYALFIDLARSFTVFAFQGSFGQKHLLIIGGMSYLLSLWTIRKNEKCLLLYLFFSLASLGIFFLENVGYAMRHNGLIYIFFFFTLWIYQIEAVAPRSRIDKRVYTIFLTIVLTIQMVCALWAARLDFVRDFSAGRKVAQFISGQNLNTDNYAFAGYRNYTFSAILPYLPGYKIYSPESKREMTYMIWDKVSSENEDMSIDALVESLYQYFTEIESEGKNLVMISNIDLSSNTSFDSQYTLLEKFIGAINSDEDFYIWLHK